MAVGVPGVVGVCSAVAVFALSAPPGSAATRTGAAAVPSELAGYSHVTASVSDSAPGPAVALYQHGFGVEFLDFPQAVVLGARGDTYRRVDVAEGRAGPETQGDPAPMLLSPDGTKVAVGDHVIDEPDVFIVDLRTGDTTSHAVARGPERRACRVVTRRTAGWRTCCPSAPTNPHRGEPIVGDVGVLDLQGGETTMLRWGREVRTAAFSPDGSQLAVQQDVATGEQLAVVDIASDTGRVLDVDGELAGPAAWSPDGRLLATTTVRSAALRYRGSGCLRHPPGSRSSTRPSAAGACLSR